MTALPWHGVRTRLAVRSREWARRRQGSDGRCAELKPRRIYILPTRAGLVYGGIVMVLLLSSMNFSNNMGFALTFLLAAVGIISMHHCQRNLSGVRVELLDSVPCFAGQQAAFKFRLHNPDSRVRWQLQTGWDRRGIACTDLNNLGSGSCMLMLSTLVRGRHALPRFSVSSTFPLGLFRAWTWIHMDAAVIVWPTPADSAVRPPATDSNADNLSNEARAGEDLSGVRDYQLGDSPRRIDWKGYARHGHLRVREFLDGTSTSAWLDWDSIDAASTEQRLSILSRLALDAQVESLRFGLRLPGTTIELAAGEHHLRQCLNALALHGTDSRPQEPHG